MTRKRISSMRLLWISGMIFAAALITGCEPQPGPPAQPTMPAEQPADAWPAPQEEQE